MADILLYPNTTNTLLPSKRIAPNVSSFVAPNSSIIEGDLGIADPNAASVFIGIPHKFKVVNHVSVTPLNAYGVTGAPYVIYKDKVQGPLAIGANYTAGTTTLTLHADSPATADTLNGFYIQINDGGNSGEIRKILDYASDVVTLDVAFDADMTSATETYTILGTAVFMTADPTGGAPSYTVSVTGNE